MLTWKNVFRQSRSAAALMWIIASILVGSVSNQTTIFKGRSTTYPAFPLYWQHLSQLNQWHPKERQLKHLDPVWKHCPADADRIWISPIARAKTIVNIIFIPLELYFKIYFKQKVSICFSSQLLFLNTKICKSIRTKLHFTSVTVILW